jgi:5'-nucleotidase
MILGGPRPFDMTISGINRGQNAGINILYSGTVAAAREAAILGMPAVAVSLFYRDENHLPYETAARVAVDVFRMVLRGGLPRGVMLNVNVPPVPYEAIRGWSVTRMGNSGYADFFEFQSGDRDGPRTFRNVGEGWIRSRPRADDHDDHAIENDCVSITPLHFDLTAYEFLDELRVWLGRSPSTPPEP